MPKFDVVVGNPPYQKGKNKVLYVKFLKLAYEISYRHVLFITPSTIFKKNLFEQIKNKFTYITIGEFIREKYFKNIGLGALFSYYLIDKYKNNHYLNLDYNRKKYYLNLNELEYNILDERNYNKILNSIFKKIYQHGKIKPLSGKGDLIKDKEDKFHIFKLNKNEKYIYPSFLSSLKERKEVYSKTKPEGYGIPKLAISNIIEPYKAERFSEFNINKGVGRYSHYFKVNDKKEAKGIQTFINSSIYKFIDIKKRHGRYAYLYIPDINYNKEWIDEELYEYFNLTQEEIDYIESQVK